MHSSHLTILEQGSTLYPSAPAFMVPRSDPTTGQVHDWLSISYRQFKEDVEHTARYYRRMFRSAGIVDNSVVGLWRVLTIHAYIAFLTPSYRLGGMTYQDVLHIYGVSRAGYIPQLFSIRLPSPDVILELLHKQDARALIYAPEFAHATRSFPLSTFVAIEKDGMEPCSEELPPLSPMNGDQTVFVFHTSGSTSGSPKLVPCSQRWLSTMVAKAKFICAPRDPQCRDVTTWMSVLQIFPPT